MAEKKIAPVRYPVLDFVRGVAVALMILSHGAYFFYQGSSIAVAGLIRAGSTLCFTLLLFISGASLYQAYLRDEVFTRRERKHALRRSLNLLLVYYFLGVISLLARVGAVGWLSAWRTIGRFVFFLQAVDFTEFLLPFVFYGLSVVFLIKFYRWVAKSFWRAILVGGVSFGVGYLIYLINLPSPFDQFKAILAGGADSYRFALLQYWLVFLLGLWWGHFLHSTEGRKERIRQVILGSLVAVIVFTAAQFLSRYFPVVLLDPVNRWPPSIGFLAVGLGVGFGLSGLYFFLTGWPASWLVFWLFEYFGQDSLDLFVTHLLLLFFYQVGGGPRVDQGLILIFQLLGLLVLSVVFSSLNWRRSPSLFVFPVLELKKRRQRRLRPIYLLAALVLISWSVWGVVKNGESLFGERVNEEELAGSRVVPLSGGELPTDWPSEDYAAFRQLTVRSQKGLRPVEAGSLVTLVISPEELPAEEWAQLWDGQAVIVYFLNKEFLPVSAAFFGDQQNQWGVSFVIEKPVYAGQLDNRYFLYYGSETKEEKKELIKGNPSGADYRVELGQEQLAPVRLVLNRRWFVPAYVEEKLVGEVTTSLKWAMKAELSSVDNFYSRQLEVIEVGRNQSRFSFDPSQLESGRYRVRISVQAPDKTVRSQWRYFNISAPVLVAWSLDWEGWGVSNQFLAKIEAQSTRHGQIPITHFFNPRIWLESAVSSEESVRLTDWVWNRRQEGDEVQLHFHLQYDLVEAAGVTPRTEPEVGDTIKGGYDVPLTAYSPGEQNRLLAWAEDQFVIHQLPKPTGFRAGYWFVDLKTISVLEERGYEYDASGRSLDGWAHELRQSWQLNSSTQPYYPSRSDQNRSGGDNFSLLEIPNNGGNCYEHTADQLVTKFRTIFAGEPTSQQKAVVFLSHPQWYNVDELKIESVLTTTDEWLYALDQGPVVYVTMSEIGKAWQ